MLKASLGLSIALVAVGGVARAQDGAIFINLSKDPCLLLFLPPGGGIFDGEFIAEVRGQGVPAKTYAITQADFAGIRNALVEKPAAWLSGDKKQYGLTVPSKGLAYLQPAKNKVYDLFLRVADLNGTALTGTGSSCEFNPVTGARWYQPPHGQAKAQHLVGPHHVLTVLNPQTLVLTDRSVDGKAAAPAPGNGAAAAAVNAHGAGTAAAPTKK